MSIKKSLLQICFIFAFSVSFASLFLYLYHAAPRDTIGQAEYVAHAMGRIDGKDYTNSLEAFQRSYAQGFRVFEVDMILSADGVPIARHSGAHMYWVLGQQIPQRILDEQTEPYSPDVQGVPLTTKEFKDLKIHGKYTPIDIYDLMRLMQKHPDISLLIDRAPLFYSNAENARFYNSLITIVSETDKTLLDRFIPAVSDTSLYDTLTALHPFKRIILFLNKKSDPSLLDFAKKNKSLYAVALYPDVARSTDYLQLAKRMNKWVYIIGAHSTEMPALKSLGADGFYVDAIGK